MKQLVKTPSSSRALSVGILVAAVSLLSASAQNQTAAAPSKAGGSAPTAAAGSAADDWAARLKNPVDWLTWGADLRVRNEYFDNLLTLSPANPLHEQDYFRFRTRVWMNLKPTDGVSLNTRLAIESREWLNQAGYTLKKGRTGWDWSEGVIDNLNVAWRAPLGLPATLTIGRQDLMLGEGWLVLEGTPNDGSSTVDFDAARLTYEFKEQHTTLDVIGIFQHAESDQWLPPINNQHRYLGDQDEKGAILYVANKSLPAANVDGYFMYKHDDRLSSAAGKYGDDADIYTFGARLSGIWRGHWKYSAEGAYQCGRKFDPNVKFPVVSTEYRDLEAFGFNSKLAYLFQDAWNNQLNFSAEFLSGDDPNTTNDEMFDSLWGRWPRWSEIGLYSYAAETRIGQEANLWRFGPGWSCTPAKRMELAASYFALFAPQEIPTREASAALFNGGNFRGHFVQAVMKYKFNSHLAGHLWGEGLFPGDYYARHSAILFLRAELTATF